MTENEKNPEVNLKTSSKMTSFFDLFYYTNQKEKMMLAAGTFCSVAFGAGLPAFSILFGTVINELGQGGDDILDAVTKLALYFVYVALGIFLSAAGMNSSFSFISKVIGGRLRIAYLSSVLSKDVAWFDVQSPGNSSNLCSILLSCSTLGSG